ncbi:MAG: methyltransferase family protein [Janthinobacterium lividum]
MGATAWEYRLRYPLHILIFVLAFWPFWEPSLGLTTKSTWLILSASLARQGWLGFQAATQALLVIAILLVALGAWLRTWGSAYVGANVVSSSSMQGVAMLVDGPYRRTRNPLYLGTLLHTIGLALLMPPAGAIFAIAAIWILQVRLALAEEPFLEKRFGQPYAAYRERVPQFLPATRPMVPSAGARPHWGQAILGESYMIGVVITLAGFGWSFNANPLLKGILISLGISLVLQGFLPRTGKKTAESVG